LWCIVRAFELLIWKLIYYLEIVTINIFRKIQRRDFTLDDLNVRLLSFISPFIRSADSMVSGLIRLTGIVWSRQDLYFNVFIRLWSLKLRTRTSIRCKFSPHIFDFFFNWDLISWKHDIGALLKILLICYPFKFVRQIRKYLCWSRTILIAYRLDRGLEVCHQRTWRIRLNLSNRFRDLLTNLFEHHYILLFAQWVNLNLWVISGWN
jgi:hypothetical protein